MIKFGDWGEVTWRLSKFQDADYQAHAENVRFVHTCLRVFVVDTGNLVVFMTETVLSTVAWGCKRKVNQKPNVAADDAD